ncbi:MAG: alpha-L-arabinofuranosidase C-terminal domain-containing protein [Paludibacter sp.]|nr:alpha-L-arabinofuranosidase C-terminal domain-containing protein [Paludibacter sp.]
MKTKSAFLFLILLVIGLSLQAQQKKQKTNYKPISPDLFGIFFEDINYAADSGLYAELVQNRSFEYSPSDKDNWQDKSNWDAYTSWQFITKGYGYGTLSLETKEPIHENNTHYMVINIEEEGREGVGLKNSGFDGIVVKAGEKYNFSVFLRQLSDKSIPMVVKLLDKKGDVIGEATFSTQSKDWKKYSATIIANQSNDNANLEVLAKTRGKLAIDMVSLFPEKTFKNRPNGLRADLAQTIADLKPKFMRFPGGCLVHGDGLGNMYRWKNTIGSVEQRFAQRNIWGYNQSVGIGYFEYFQYCEDMGAKPIPVVPAGVSCQNSGGTWRIDSNGQKGIPLAEMHEYIQEILDLIEWANGPATSTWGAKRVEAGHPKSFNLEYIGIGNEDKQTAEFRERFKMISDIVKAKHPEITIIGTIGPGQTGEDFDLGWKFANELKTPMVDEHFYDKPEWFISNQKRYDSYNRSKSKVYIGEYASKGNTLYDAIAEAAFMTSLERNGDVVRLASYAPLLAKEGHTQWNPDMIYFNNKAIYCTANYYIQQLFSTNQGDTYYENVITSADNKADSTLAFSCVRDSKTGDVILKLVNCSKNEHKLQIDLSQFKQIGTKAILTTLTGTADAKNSFEEPNKVIPVTSDFKVGKNFNFTTHPMSMTVIRVKMKR